MQTKVLLSIKPEFAEKIFNGSKMFEFRKILFKNLDVSKIVVYASNPVQKVIGEFEIDRILSMDPEKLWEQTHSKSGIEQAFFFEYFKGKKIGHAIGIKDAKLYEQPKNLFDASNLKHPPQSFAYITQDAKKIE